MQVLWPAAALCLAVLVLVESVGANDGDKPRDKGRRSRKMNKITGRKSKCKYYKKGEISACDPQTQQSSVTFHLKKGINCPPTQVYQKPCDGTEMSDQDDNNVKGCKYDRNATWSECGKGVLSRKKVMMLKTGQPASCPPTRTKTVPCKRKKSKSKGKPGRIRNKKNKKGGKGKPCKYKKGAWTECDMITSMRSRELTLKKGDKSCQTRKTVTKKCKKRQ